MSKLESQPEQLQEIGELDNSLWRNAQERDRYCLTRSAYEYWRPTTPFDPELPLNPRDLCTWRGKRTGILRSDAEGVLYVKRYVTMPIALEPVVIRHDTAYQYTVRSKPGNWSPGWVAAKTSLELSPDIDIEVRESIVRDDLKSRVEFEYPRPEDDYEALLEYMRQGDSVENRVPAAEVPGIGSF